MDLGLEGKVALVGGGSQGIGHGVAQVLLAEGAEVAIYALDDAHLPAARRRLEADHGRTVLALPGDVTRAEDCARFVDETVAAHGGLDVLVTNMASAEYRGAVLAEGDDDWRHEFELYANAVIRLSRLAMPHLIESRGAIVNISSCGVHELIPELAVSEVVRLATAGFANYLAREVAPHGVRVTSVLPGWIAGERIDSMLRAEARSRQVDVAAVYAENHALIPAGRFGMATEVGDAVAFLASDRARYITGTSLRVDGGWAKSPTG